jgi:hypothetical protein
MKTTPALKILERQISEWPQAINATRANLQEIESELAAITQRAALLHGYLSHRYNTGCGDQGHEDSARIANRNLTKIRKAMGYTMPESGVRI